MNPNQTPVGVANGPASDRSGLLASTALTSGDQTLATDAPTIKPPLHQCICGMILNLGTNPMDIHRLPFIHELVEGSSLKREHASEMLAAADKRCVELQTRIAEGDTTIDESLVPGLRDLSSLLTQKLDNTIAGRGADHQPGGGDTAIAERGPVHDAA